MEGEQHQPRRDLGRGDRGHHRLVPAVDWHTLEELGALRRPGGPRAADCVEDLGHPQTQRHRLAAAQRRGERTRLRIEGEHVALAVERDRGVGHSGQQRLDQGIAGLGRRRLVPACSLRRQLAAAGRDQRRECDEQEAGQGRHSGKRIKRPQAAEHDDHSRQQQPHAPESTSHRRVREPRLSSVAVMTRPIYRVSHRQRQFPFAAIAGIRIATHTPDSGMLWFAIEGPQPRDTPRGVGSCP